MPEPYHRLAAIMFTDIVGYSALMQESENDALRILEKNRNLQKTLIELYHGKYLKEIGDGILACFDSASDAVRCASELQRVAKEDTDLKLHIGIHLGEVIFSEDDVYGDGVNIASRIDALAKDGEIYISEDVWKNIKNKEGLSADYLGKQKFKNIKDPIGLYKLSGLRTETRNGIKGSMKKSFMKILIGITILIVITGTFYLIHEILQNGTNKKLSTSDNSIVVLPFKNITGDEEGQYFADGVMETIRNHLAKIKSLKVISRTSAERYREPGKSAPQIAAELGVVYLLEGSTQKFGNRIQINVELINAQEDDNIWGEVFERELTDLFIIQSEIAQEVVDAMKAQITSEEYQRIVEIPTQNLDAYDLYVKGRYYWNKRTVDNMLESLEYFKQAVEIDPEFAQAWSGIADAYSMLSAYNYMSSAEGHSLAKDAANKAIKINNTLAEAHTSLGWLYAFYNHEWKKSRESFDLALKYEPSYSTAHHWYAWMLAAQGKFDRAKQHIQMARSVDPLSSIIMASAGWIYYVSRDYPRARDLFKSAIELDPDFPRSHFWLGQNYMVNKQYDSAIYHLEIAVNLSERHPQYLSSLGLCYGVAQQYENAQNILKEIMEISDKRFVTNYDIGLALLGINQEEAAMEYFEKAYQDRDTWITFIAVDPRFIYLRDNLDFQNIIKKTGITPSWVK